MGLLARLVGKRISILKLFRPESFSPCVMANGMPALNRSWKSSYDFQHIPASEFRERGSRECLVPEGD